MSEPVAQLTHDWLVTDLDGTLVDRAHLLVPRSVDALNRYRAAGGRVFIATGRNRPSAGVFYAELGLDTPQILQNGAQIVPATGGPPLMDRHLGEQWPHLREKVLPEVPEGIAVLAYCGDEVLVLRDSPVLAAYAPGILKYPAGGVPPEPINKLMLIAGRPQGDSGPLPGLCELITHKVPDVVPVFSESTYLEILPGGVGKGEALRVLAAREGVDLSRIAAIGDNPNDLTMLATAGLGAAVGDGHPDVRGQADVVVGTCAGGAVADLVDHIMR
jgi:hydroxymethylpyrimidine pyrophosphatase-like HAD family hydrolase